MQIINELEKESRGVYTGAIGYFSPDGSAIFNVPIRTVRLRGGSGEMGIGAGITHDSVPVEEWKESLLKGKFLTHSQPEFELFESLLWQPGSGYWLLDEHIQRLAGGAQFFKFSFDEEKARGRLLLEETKFNNSCHRVRLVLKKDGRLSMESFPCNAPATITLPLVPEEGEDKQMPLVEISTHRVDTNTPWCFYKTTRRELYNNEYQRAQKEGLFDYIFCNQNGEVTEGCITNVIIYTDGKYKTPPVACGLLPGVLRSSLLHNSRVPVVEEVLTKEDIETAEAIFVCNSVRGLIRVKLREFFLED